MSLDAEDTWFDKEAGHLVRPYAITGGRTESRRTEFSLITLVVTTDPRADTSRLAPEPASILGLCQDQPLAVAEIAAQLDLPVSVVKVLLGDLADAALILTRAPVPLAEAPDLALIQTVIRAVRNL